MATKIKISFSNNIINFNTLDIVIFRVGYTRHVVKNFITGTPANVNQVLIGSTLSQTLSNLLANLSVNDIDSIVQYAVVGDDLFIDFSPPGAYDYNINSFPTGAFAYLITYSPPAVVSLLPLILCDFSIEIIDTYTNLRNLIVEDTQINSPKLIFDSGDDIVNAFMISKLTFNMLVADKSDGKFFHLYTGDEQRYKVKLWSVSLTNVKELIWQGYLLPDLYNEPYKNGVFFVNFTAVDMIGLLKGKFLKPWFYNNRIPIMRLLGYILEKTGLQQEFIVAPSLIPNIASVLWHDINVPLSHYVDGDKYVDCYQILKDILETNALTLYSYRGYWFIKGVTRKFEVVNESCYQFDSFGILIGTINIVNNVWSPMMLEGTSNISAVTPWKKVNVEVSQKRNDSILSDQVVKLKNEYLKSINETNPVFTGSYYTAYFDNWTKNTGLFAVANSPDQFSYLINNAGAGYSLTESQALINYFECNEKPFLLAHTNYTIAIEAEVRFYCYDDTAKAYFRDNFLTLQLPVVKNAFNFQVLINGNEIASSRLGYFENQKFKVDISNVGFDEINPSVGIVKYLIKGPLLTHLEGRISVRILMPIFYQNPNPPATLQLYEIICNQFEIKLVKENAKINEDCVAVRSINYTQESDVKINFTCTKNEFVKNNFGLRAPQFSNYFTDVPVFNLSDPILHQNVIYSPTLIQLTGVINLKRSQINFGILTFLKLFGSKLLRKNLFIIRANGEEQPFQYVAGKVPNKLVFIGSQSLNPIIPENYIPMSDIASGDALRFMDVVYEEEDISQRNKWVINGLNDENTFVKSLANAMHYVRPETVYSLEATFMQCILPNELISFEYFGLVRNFIPTRLEIDLTDGKTIVKSTESKFTVLTDITYE